MSPRLLQIVGTLLLTLYASLSASSSVSAHCYGPFIVPHPCGHWVDTWTTVPAAGGPQDTPPPPFDDAVTVFENATIRQTIRVTVGAPQIRLRISNVFGTTPLTITSATVALADEDALHAIIGSSAINTTSLRQVTFSDEPDITIAGGALAVSDPLNFPVPSAHTLSISLFLATGQQAHNLTAHTWSLTNSWTSPGNQTAIADIANAPDTHAVAHWYYITAVEAWQPNSRSALAIVGDSITDGAGSTANANGRWPDLLYDRLAASDDAVAQGISVLNQGEAGNQVLAGGMGPPLMTRVGRDVLAHSGVGYVLLYEGVNDIGNAAPDEAAQEEVYRGLVQAYRQIVARIHTHGIPVFGGTITPFMNGCKKEEWNWLGIYPIREQTRLRLNEFIREAGVFDGVVDFDVVMRNPANHTVMRSEYSSGDCLHPNQKGHAAMPKAFPIELLKSFERGVDGFT